MAIDWVPPEPIRPDEPIITPATPPELVPAWLRAHHEAAARIEERREYDHGEDQELASGA